MSKEKILNSVLDKIIKSVDIQEPMGFLTHIGISQHLNTAYAVFEVNRSIGVDDKSLHYYVGYIYLTDEQFLTLNNGRMPLLNEDNYFHVYPDLYSDITYGKKIEDGYILGLDTAGDNDAHGVIGILDKMEKLKSEILYIMFDKNRDTDNEEREVYVWPLPKTS